MNSGDTIAAISSSVGPAARIILRASGPLSLPLARKLGLYDEPEHGSASRCQISFRDLSVPSWVYLFRAPRSYTGEDLVEFHIPGNPILAKLLLHELLEQGARPAEPGEFTARAFFNGRIDLTNAEGVAATIAAGNEQELAAARRLMSGELARRLMPTMDLLTATLALVEVGIDFSQEDVSFLSHEQERDRIRQADDALSHLLDESTRFERLSHEPRVVLVGRPNAGKSTLLNALAGHERAVVSSIAGTTRDVLSAEVMLARGIVRVIDVAGVGETQHTSDIERQMQTNALRAADTAEVLVLVQEVSDSRPPPQLSRDPALVIHTKLDLNDRAQIHAELGTSTWHGLPFGSELEAQPQGRRPARASDAQMTGDLALGGFRDRDPLARGGSPCHERLGPRREIRHGDSAAAPSSADGKNGIAVSALTGAGMDDLRRRLDSICFGESGTGASLALNLRHVRALNDSRTALARAANLVGTAGAEVLALELREAIDSLGGILGRVTPDDVLGRIFSGFCIGK